MVDIRLYTLSIFLFILCTIGATEVSGTVGNCQGKELKIYTISNFLTGERQVVDSCIVDQHDRFIFNFHRDRTDVYCINLGKYQAQIILKPEQHLVADLPDYAPLTKKEYLNPYFKTENILVYDESTKDLNRAIKEIELMTARQLKRILESTSPEFTALSAIDTIEQKYTSLNNRFLKAYLKYSSAVFYQMAQPNKKNLVKKLFFQEASPDIKNPAFTELFTSEYENPFIAPDGLFYQLISDAIIKGEIPDNFITSIAKIHNIKSPQMAELIAIKGFYDAANYAPNYQAKITTLMQQLEEQIANDDLRMLCHSSRTHIQKFMVGSPAPYYELYTPKGKKVPTVLKRRHVLLAFVNTNIFECQRHLRLLEKYKSTYKRQLEIIVITAYQNEKELERFLSRNTYDGLYFVLWDNNENLLHDYDVKALPTYYLIDRDGKFRYSPMSSPEEDMQEELQNALGF